MRLIIALLAECYREPVGNASALLDWEYPKDKVLSTTRAEHQQILPEQLKQCDIKDQSLGAIFRS